MSILGLLKISKRKGKNENVKKNRVLLVMLHIFVLYFIIVNREIYSALKLHENGMVTFQKPSKPIYSYGARHIQNNTKLKPNEPTKGNNHWMTNIKLGNWLGSGAKELRTGKKPFFMCSEEEEDCDVRYDVNRVAEDQLSKL